MSDNKITTPLVKKQKQLIALIFAGIVLAIIVIGLSLSDVGGIEKVSEETKEEEYTITIADPTKNAKIEQRWLVNAQGTVDSHSKALENITVENEKLKAELEKLQTEKQLQEEKFSNLEMQIQEISNKISSQNAGNSKEGGVEYQSSITTINAEGEIHEEETKPQQKIFNVNDGYIPQGSYAPAKVISAVDIQVGIASQANPKPVLLRLKGFAKSAMFQGKKLTVDLTGCVITGGAVGELSSEKVYIKLSKMTCAKDEENVFEVPVQGYVSAKGSNGIRGDVIMREGDLIGKSFLSGMVGGLGQTYSQSLAPPLTFGGGTTTMQAISPQDAVKRGVGGGLGASGNQISSYLIKRAEQYQPIISIPAGIEVEVVFLEGFYLDGRIKTVTNAENINNSNNTIQNEERVEQN